jgi:hypothetical protein
MMTKEGNMNHNIAAAARESGRATAPFKGKDEVIHISFPHPSLTPKNRHYFLRVGYNFFRVVYNFLRVGYNFFRNGYNFFRVVYNFLRNGYNFLRVVYNFLRNGYNFLRVVYNFLRNGYNFFRNGAELFDKKIQYNLNN